MASQSIIARVLLPALTRRDSVGTTGNNKDDQLIEL